MKKIFLAVCLSLAVIAASAQDFRIGLKGTFNSTWLFNNNISDQGNIADYASTFGTSFGISSVLYFTENIGVAMDILYASNNQKLEGEIGPGLTYESVANVKYIDIPLLLRISSEGGPYVEFGPQFSFLAGATEDFTTSPSSPTVEYTDKDFKDDFSGFGLAVVLGFGVDIQANDNWFINIGLRFGYGMTDATTEFTEAQVDADDAAGKHHSVYSGWAHTDATPDFNYQKTNRAFGGFTLGVIYKFD